MFLIYKNFMIINIKYTKEINYQKKINLVINLVIIQIIIFIMNYI